MARGVNWQRFTQQQLLEICDCVGGLGLAAVLRLMAEDHAGAAGEVELLRQHAKELAVRVYCFSPVALQHHTSVVAGRSHILYLAQFSWLTW